MAGPACIPTALTLAANGAEVTLAIHNEAAAKKAVEDIIRITGNPRIYTSTLDLSKCNDIDHFVDEWEGPLDILINDAGVMAIPELQLTEEGWELQFATNYMGHFILTLGLHAALAAANGARVAAVSSSGHLLSPVIFDDIHLDFRFYDPWVAYGQSKTAVVLFASVDLLACISFR